MSYESEVKNVKKYKGNVVILLRGKYYAIRQPDSGLVIPIEQAKGVVSLTINPTSVDFKRANQTIASYSFRLLDKALIITKELVGLATLFLNDEVRIWIGRSGVAMPFADYFELPRTTISKVGHSDNSYNFASKDATARMLKDVYNTKTVLQADITALTVAFIVESTDGFGSSGYLRINNEIVSYAAKTATQFQGIIRGEFGTVPSIQNFGDEVSELFKIIGNPITLILQIWTSTGAGTNGAYDVLPKGLGINSSLIDIGQLEQLRVNFFNGDQFTLYLYEIDNTLRFLEEQLFQATGTRLITNSNQLVSLTLLDQASLDDSAANPIGEDSIDAYPTWDVEIKDIVNTIEISYDFQESTGKYLYKKTFFDQDSKNTFGEIKPLSFKFKGIREVDLGLLIINSLGKRLLSRFSSARPEISISTHIDKSLINVGDKVYLTSSQIPTGGGTLNFADSLEVVTRAIDPISGDCKFKLQFTSYTGTRGSYIAPSSTIVSVLTQSKVSLSAGRGDGYEVGWKVRLFNKLTFSFEPDPVNEISLISGDDVSFINPWTTILTINHSLRFADFDQVAESQKKFAFIGKVAGANFDDGSSPYKIGI